jgi:hypothetical protein
MQRELNDALPVGSEMNECVAQFALRQRHGLALLQFERGGLYSLRVGQRCSEKIESVNGPRRIAGPRAATQPTFHLAIEIRFDPCCTRGCKRRQIRFDPLAGGVIPRRKACDVA